MRGADGGDRGHLEGVRLRGAQRVRDYALPHHLPSHCPVPRLYAGFMYSTSHTTTLCLFVFVCTRPWLSFVRGNEWVVDRGEERKRYNLLRLSLPPPLPRCSSRILPKPLDVIYLPCHPCYDYNELVIHLTYHMSAYRSPPGQYSAQRTRRIS